MAYDKGTWTNEVLEGSAPVYTLKRYADNSIIDDDVLIEIKNVTTEGSLLSAAAMDNIETGIETLDLLFDVTTGHNHDGTNSKKISFPNIIDTPFINNAGAHNSIYRGISLGTSVSAAQYTAIAAGTFDDMYIGDYWTIGGVVWRIWHFNYYYNVGDANCTTPHVTIVPDTCLYNAQMNATDVVTGAYAGSAMYTTNLAQAKTAINAAFGEAHILSHRVLLTNVVSENAATSWAWYDSTVELLTEHQVYGARAFGAPANNGYGIASQDGQFAAASLHHAIIHNRNNYWLQDVVSATGFAGVDLTGRAGYGDASYSLGVRPAFSIIG